MRTTSHFVGASLDSSRFTDLFVKLQEYSTKHDLQDALKLQNVLSLHLTLYYLASSISKKEKAQILEDIADLSSNDKLKISQLNGAYFGEPGKEQICYLSTAKNVKFEEINQFFAKKYDHSQIPENQLAFVAHISLFRIIDPVAFTAHKVEVDTIISKVVATVDCDNLAEGLHLFQVNSLYHPEIQIPI